MDTLLDAQPAYDGDYDDYEEERTTPPMDDKLRAALKELIGSMEGEAMRRVGVRTPIETRWMEDLRYFHGRYDEKTEAELNDDPTRSKVFINATQQKTNAMAARLMDLLFPTDDRNWGIQPTPVPTLAKSASEAAAKAREMRTNLNAATPPDLMTASPEQLTAVKQVLDAESAARVLENIIDQARKCSELMAAEIDDQLRESNWQAIARDVIDSACKLGIGVCKGPVTGDKIRRGWKRDPETNQFGLSISNGETPAMRVVDVWNFFPDMDVPNLNDGTGVYERHPYNEKQLRNLALMEGFDKAAIRRLLVTKPTESAPSYIANLRSLSREQVSGEKQLYMVWEYSGTLDCEHMKLLAQAAGDVDTYDEMSNIDPLKQVNAVVWFCQGEVLKFTIYPYDSGECLYSAFTLFRDEYSVFGYGIPAIMRDPQTSLAAAWRMMMDNGAASVGPQIVVDLSQIEPVNGGYDIRPFKVWKAKGGLTGVDRRAFEIHDIPNQQAPLANIINMSMQFIDMMTAMPQLAQGEQGSGVTKTAQGMAILMNSANVVFRRIVKNFDDDLTTPTIRRFYDWNMQFNPKDEIKGDYNVDARGSSVLLVREMQAQNLMALSMQYGGHPIYGKYLKERDMLKKVFQSLMIPAEEVLLTQEQVDAIAAEAAEAAKNAVDEMKLRTRELDIREAELDAETAIEQMKRDTEMMKYANDHNLSLDKIAAGLQQVREQLQSKERIAAAEFAMTERIGQPSGGGYV